jgi:hypothetical protein
MTCSRCYLLFFAVAIISCNQPRYVYTQSARNLHFFQDKGQAKVSGAWTTGPSRGVYGDEDSYNNGVDLQAAYAFADKWAVSGSYMARKERDLIQTYDINRLVTDVKYKRKALEIGVSYFTILDRSNATYFHVDGGVGWGKDQIRELGRLDSLSRTRSYNDRNLKLFAQPGLYTGAKAVRFGMGVRVQWAGYSDIKTDYTQAEMELYNLAGLNKLFMIEPYLALRFGPTTLPWIKGEFQFSFTGTSNNYYVRGAILSFGLVIDPSEKAR